MFTNMSTDLFGVPIMLPPPRTLPSKRSPEDSEKRLEVKRNKFMRELQESPTAVLFRELLDYLKPPLFHLEAKPDIFQPESRRGFDGVEEIEAVSDGLPEIPYAAWGPSVITDRNGHKWSEEGIVYLQALLLWESMEALSLNNNEHDKWSVLKWVFQPAIRKSYVWDKKLGKSHCFHTHENDEPFSFHNCCIAARVDDEVLREGFRRNMSVEILNAVMQVCRFD